MVVYDKIVCYQRSNPIQKLNDVRNMTINYLQELKRHVGDYGVIVEENDAEIWSFRKILRRMVWHELWHVKQINKKINYDT